MPRSALRHTVDASGRRRGVVGRLGGFLVLASLALAFVAVALTALKA
jgi:hypothetical protein